MNEITFTPVKRSDTLEGVAFYPEHGDLLVRFKRNNSVYLYKGADADLFKHLVNTPHPWSKFRSVVQALPYEKVTSGLRTEPLKVKRVEIKAASKSSAKATEPAQPEVTVKRGPGRPRRDGTAAQPRVVVDGKKVRAEDAPKVEAKKPATRRRSTPAADKLPATGELTPAQKRAALKAIAEAQANAPKL